MNLLLIASLLAAAVSNVAAVPRFQFKRDEWSYQKNVVKGVNLGGWFVLEPYMNPSLFEAFGDDESQIPVDEYHYTKALGKVEALSRLQQHWGSWIVEDDFKQISDLGLNMVRIPIGYWAFKTLDDDPYVQGQVEFFDQALEWARNSGLKVWIDLHGAPGSQNGFDNSGLRDCYDFQTDENISLTLTVLQEIFNKYGGDDYSDVVIGIELLNEPLGSVLDMGKLNDFWTWGYDNLRGTGSTQNVIIHDAFTASGYFNDKFQAPEFWNVVIDHHHYQVFSPSELQRNINEHISVACQWGEDHRSENLWSVTGEWSAALTDCAKWLNGVGRGARYDDSFYESSQNSNSGSCWGSQDINSWSDDKKTNTRKYIEAQLDAFESKGGWIFWNWKTENTLEWDFQRLSYNGLFPSPLTARQFPGQCS